MIISIQDSEAEDDDVQALVAEIFGEDLSDSEERDTDVGEQDEAINQQTQQWYVPYHNYYY